MGIGAVIGIILGLLAGLGAYFWQGLPNELPLIGMAIGLSLIIVLPLAAFLDFFIPYLLLKMDWDHAPGADPFSKVKMDQNDDGLWIAEVYSEQSEIRYQITDFAHSDPIHGSAGILKADTELYQF